MDEYEKAKKASKTGEFDLPISNVKLIYDKNSLTMKVITENNRSISIYSASSGIQSVTPLSIVSKYITEEVSSNFLKNIQKLSANERKQIKEWIKKDTKDEEKNQLLRRTPLQLQSTVPVQQTVSSSLLPSRVTRNPRSA